MNILDIIVFQFFLFSIGGWLLEVLYRGIGNRKFINAGFNIGPYVPLYGIAAVLIILTHGYIAQLNILLRAIVYLIVTTGIEFITGELTLLVFKKRYWDYSENFKNIRGHICPSFSLAWILACFVFELLLLPASIYAINLIGLHFLKTINIILVAIFTIDFIYSSGLGKQTIYISRKYGSFVAETFKELPGETGTILFNSPKFRIARKQLHLLVNQDHIKQVEKKLNRHWNQAITISSLIFKKR